MDSIENISFQQRAHVFEVANEIISNLPPKALQQLSEAYDNDIEKLLDEIFAQTVNVINFNKTIESQKIDYLEQVKSSMDNSLKKLSYNYFKTTMLTNFRQGWRNLEWGNMIQLFPNSVYLAARSHGKCLAPDTEVVMYSGEIRKVKDLRVGDLLMGVDSTPRKILELHTGTDEMFCVEQSRTENYVCNSEHILHYKYREYIWNNALRKRGDYYDSIQETPVKEFIKFSENKKNRCKSYRVKGWELPEKEQPVEPYFIGLWLGDGNSGSTHITNTDPEVIDYLYEYAARLDLGVSRGKGEAKFHFKITNGVPGQRNKILNTLKSLDMLNNKHIPDLYMYGSRKQRLELLAGLLDSDGHFYKSENTFDIGMINERLMRQVQELCWSLGFRASFRKRTSVLNLKGGPTEYTGYSVKLSGDTWDIPTKIARKKAVKKENHWMDLQKSSFKVSSIGVGEYIGFSVDKDHLFLLKDGTVLHNSFEFCYAFPLWRLYSYDRPNVMQPNTPDNQNRKETCIITNTITLGKEHIDKIVEEIEVNDLLAEKLNPNGKASLAATGIETELGAKIHLRGKDGFIRGLHVGAVVCDDLPDESSIYSLEQREKLHNLFKGAISPIVEPYGYFLVSGTPYQERDLYYELKQDKRFKVFEYPAIFPNGKLLAPDRFTFDKLMEEKASLGSLVFSREYLVVPISDDATIFPYEILMRSVIGMENISFSDNIEGFPIKLKKVVIGADFAISGNVSADYTVYTVWGMDEQGLYYLLHMYRVRGASHDEQINQLVSLDQRFKPNMIVVENNGFQTILGSMAKQRGLRNIEPFTTTSSNKKDLHSGLPSLAAMFERGEIRIPYKAGRTKELVDVLFGEFNSIAFRSDKGTLESVSGHEDTCMSSFFALTNLRENKAVKIKIDLV